MDAGDAEEEEVCADLRSGLGRGRATGDGGVLEELTADDEYGSSVVEESRGDRGLWVMIVQSSDFGSASTTARVVRAAHP